MTTRSVGVVIAARNAGATIGAAVGSALRCAQVSELVVVSDGSADGTAAAAAGAASGDDRLRVLSLASNVGPAEARNRGMAMLTTDLVAVLDADDQFLPGRFEALLTREDWDLVADNVVFVPALGTAPSWTAPDRHDRPRFEPLSLVQFALGNLVQPGRSRGEMGFLKPVVSRAFLDRHRLRYDPRLRLGEDYDLYVRILAAQGRFLLTRQPGYLALVRRDSLSSRHGTADLEALCGAMRDHLAHPGLDAAQRSALARVLRQMERRHAHRAILDRKAQGGATAALLALAARPAWVPAVARGVVRDKLGWGRHDALNGEDFRLLLAEEPTGSG